MSLKRCKRTKVLDPVRAFRIVHKVATHDANRQSTSIIVASTIKSFREERQNRAKHCIHAQRQKSKDDHQIKHFFGCRRKYPMDIAMAFPAQAYFVAEEK